ncbi:MULTISPECIES: RNA polymerase sigma factor [Pseudidiomarina]|uniref:RNA polymerase sigma factor (Sigma-70 family) n=2 Tax=Pseudidiomarina TaxID=2800384 RepID=A0A368V0J8_9GAMM|nr:MULTISPECIES: sigma-70 family RNA polymerase sigma factor [Pseudidiomarina]PWW14475.1 RNA polymerase sigma factor (sigma-70 family) [Pseudidiomarina maritima]RBP92525.1 RNA polymerase sigma factor (sigma-70 family) [Pseudidiomarina tainanensis]RCW34333.1 RNA polymerase sigma factor (sigma-70 family) [Pseudidiomarina tainanensis]
MSATGFGQPVSVTLVQAAQRGQNTAQRQLFEQFQRPVLQTLFGLCHDREQAKDWAQEVFLQAFAKLPQLREPQAFGGWLKKSAINYALAQLRKQHLDLDLDSDYQQLLDTNADPSQTADWHSFGELENILPVLTAAERSLVWLYLVEDYNHNELAAMFDTNAATVRKRYQRALEKLRQAQQFDAPTGGPNDVS